MTEYKDETMLMKRGDGKLAEITAIDEKLVETKAHVDSATA